MRFRLLMINDLADLLKAAEIANNKNVARKTTYLNQYQ